MKIGFPAAGTDGTEKFLLSGSFIEKGLMGVFDTTSGEVEIVAQEKLGGNMFQWAQETNLNAIITPELQMMALKVFNDIGVKVYKAEGSMLSLNVALLENKNLPMYSADDLFGQGGCSSSACSSCSSTSCG